jgi:hypothetical protein
MAEIKVLISYEYEKQEFAEETAALRREMPEWGLPLRVLRLRDLEVPHMEQPDFDIIKRYISQIDLVLLLLGQRYSLWMETEYRAAHALNKPLLTFVKDVPERDAGVQALLAQIPQPFIRFRSIDELLERARNALAELLIGLPHHFNVTAEDFASPHKEAVEQVIKRTQPDTKLCFVMMPIGKFGSAEYQTYKNIYNNVIKPAVEFDKQNRPSGLYCLRADEISKSGNVMRQIIENVASAEIVVADLTESNPNVLYELGVRHALRRKTILIAQKGQELPFDTSSYRTVFYDPVAGSQLDAIDQIREIIAAIKDDPDVKDSPVMDWIGYR